MHDVFDTEPVLTGGGYHSISRPGLKGATPEQRPQFFEIIDGINQQLDSLDGLLTPVRQTTPENDPAPEGRTHLEMELIKLHQRISRLRGEVHL